MQSTPGHTSLIFRDLKRLILPHLIDANYLRRSLPLATKPTRGIEPHEHIEIVFIGILEIVGLGNLLDC